MSTERVSISGSIANMLTYLGSLYRNPADAIKEYVSNAIDAWEKAAATGARPGPCVVGFRLQRHKITIEYDAPGMDEAEFRTALKQVADSAKRSLPIRQIGRLGIGIFAFNQIGDAATFYSRKSLETPTVKVVLKRDQDVAELSAASPDEALERPGMKIVIGGVTSDPAKGRSPLGWDRLSACFAEIFDSYLQSGTLKIEIRCGRHTQQVKPKPLDLPRLLARLPEISLQGDPSRTVRLQLHFDEAGKSCVAIRHSGVVIVGDVKNCPGYGLEESTFTSGFVKGYIDADFLTPLPARTGFADNQAWKEFVAGLGNVHAQLEREVQKLQDESRQRNLTEIQKKAIRLASDILNQEAFRDLELLAGMRKPKKPSTPRDDQKKGILSAVGRITQLFRRQPPEPGTKPGGLRIAYDEKSFPDGPTRHSEFTAGTIVANTRNPDYKTLVTNEEKLSYAALLIGKETIAYDDKTGSSNRTLEKMLSYLFAVQRKVHYTPRSLRKGRRILSRRRRKTIRRSSSVRGSPGKGKPQHARQARLPL